MLITPDLLHVGADGKRPGLTVGLLKTNHPTLRYLKKEALVVLSDGTSATMSYIQSDMPEAKQSRSSTKLPTSDWCDLTYAQTLDIFTHNPSKVRNFTEKDAALTGGDAGGIRLQHDVTGDALDVGRYLDGEPECFASLDNGQPRAKRVHIIVNAGYIHNVQNKSILRRQKRLVRLIDWLESQNVRCQVTALSSSQTGHFEVIVKQYHDPLDLNDVAITMHTAWYRRLYFRFAEYSPTWQGGYGTPRSIDDALQSNPSLLHSDDANELVVYVGSDFADFQDEINPAFDTLETDIATKLASDAPLNASTMAILT